MASELGVQTIQHTNGTTAATIDSSGRMKVGGNKIAWFAERSGDQTGYNGTAGNADPVIYNDVQYNYGSGYSGTTGEFTAPVKGIYMFHAGAWSNGINMLQLWPLVNDARKRSIIIQGDQQYASGSGLIELESGDTLGIKAYSNNSSTTIKANEYHTFFKGALIMAY